MPRPPFHGQALEKKSTSMPVEERLQRAREARANNAETLEQLVSRLDPKQKKAVENASPRWRIRYARVLLGEEGKTTALKVACAACVGFEDVEAAVGQCKATTCPLHLHRPHQDGKEDDVEEKEEKEADSSPQDG